MDIENELDVLLADPSHYTLESGEVVDVYKCKVKQLGKISALLRLVFEELGVKSVEDPEPSINLNDPKVYFVLFEKCEQATLDVISALCSLSKEQVEDLDIAEAIELLLCIFMLNKDFFLKRALPVIRSLMPPA